MKARDPYYRWPYTFQMNFAIQRELLRDLSVKGGLRQFAQSQATDGPGPELPKADAGRHCRQLQPAPALHGLQ